MGRSSPQHESVFGYLTTLNSAEHGYFGGYLLVSALGRPLEFHCTVPVRPSRAQEILYGPTLQPYLLGEQIGGTLLGEAKLKPLVIITDQAAMLCLRSQAKVPLVLLSAANGSSTHDDDAGQYEGDDDDPHILPSASVELSTNSPARESGTFQVSTYEVLLPPGFESDCNKARELLIQLAVRVELAEPFERIHDAIREAQRIGGRTQGSHGQAA